MNCLSLTEIVRLHEAGNVSPAAREHLASCAECRSTLENLKEAESLVSDIRSSENETRALGRANLPSIGGHVVVREIGRGGMGVVYEAVQPHLNRRVALKVLPALLNSLKPDSAQRFKAEAAAAAGLQHPGIVPIHGYGEDDGCQYYVMELIRGVPLSDVIHRHLEQRDTTPGYIRQVAGWMADVAEALHFAHNSGVIHRDIKPSNLILAESGAVLITDFGLAKDTTTASITETRGVMGTWRYMSPEQARAERTIDHRTDVYSLGATLYELLTLQPAIAGQDNHELLRNVIEQEPVPPRRINHAVPRDLETICLTALAKEAHQRYDTAADMAADLRRFTSGRPILARKPEITHRLWGLLRRNRPMVALVITGLLAAATLWLAGAYLELSREHAELRVQHAAALMTRARSELENGQYFIAASVFEQALINDPTLTYAYGMMARAHIGARAFDRAIGDLDRAIATALKKDELLLTRGVVHLLRDDHAAAVRDFLAARSYAPERLDAWCLLNIATLGHGSAVPVPAGLAHRALAVAIDSRLAGTVDDDDVWNSTTLETHRSLVGCLLGRLAEQDGDSASAHGWYVRAANIEGASYAVGLLATASAQRTAGKDHDHDAKEKAGS